VMQKACSIDQQSSTRFSWFELKREGAAAKASHRPLVL